MKDSQNISDKYKKASTYQPGMYKTPEYDYVFKICLLGDSGVGKSSLRLKFVDGAFTESFISTRGVDFKMKTIDLSSKKVKLHIWDTAGQERFRTQESTEYVGQHACLIVCDVTKPKSFNNVEEIIEKAKQKHGDHVLFMLVGAKNDLYNERKVNYEDARELADQLQIPYIETSAKTGENVDAAFLEMADLLYKKVAPEKDVTIKKANLPAPTENNSDGCTLF